MPEKIIWREIGELLDCGYSEDSWVKSFELDLTRVRSFRIWYHNPMNDDVPKLIFKDDISSVIYVEMNTDNKFYVYGTNADIEALYARYCEELPKSKNHPMWTVVFTWNVYLYFDKNNSKIPSECNFSIFVRYNDDTDMWDLVMQHDDKERVVCDHYDKCHADEMAESIRNDIWNKKVI